MARLPVLGVAAATQAWLPLAPLAIAAVLWWVASERDRLAYDLDLYGVDAVAVILDRERRVVERESERRTDHFVTYRFQRPDGSLQEVRARVSADYYGRVTAGQEVPLSYLPDAPERAEIEPGRARAGAGSARLAAGIFAAAGVGLAVFILARTGDLWRATLAGEVRRARVTAHRTPASRSGRGPRPRGSLVWRDATGAEGASSLLPLDRLAPYPVGSEIDVVVDRRSGRAFWPGEFG